MFKGLVKVMPIVVAATFPVAVDAKPAPQQCKWFLGLEFCPVQKASVEEELSVKRHDRNDRRNRTVERGNPIAQLDTQEVLPKEGRAAKKTEREAQKAERKEERAAKKAEREAQKAEREAQKAERKEERAAKKAEREAKNAEREANTDE